MVTRQGIDDSVSHPVARREPRKATVWAGLVRYRVVLVTGFAALVYLTSLTPLVQGADDATYIGLAKALAGGQGYRQVWLPEVPPETHFPIGFPLLLAPVLVLLPGFPVNVSALILVSVFFGVLTLPLLHRLLTEQSDLSQPEILLVVLLATLNPLTLRFTSLTVMSEVTYTWFSLAALWLARRYRAAPGWRNWYLLLLAAALAMSYLLRVVGITLIAAVGLDLLWRRGGRKVLALLASVALLLASWLYRNAQVSTGAATLSYGGDFWLKDYAHPEWGRIQSPLELAIRVVSNAWEHVTRQWPYLFLPNLGGNAVSSFIGRFGLGWLVAAIGLGLVALVLLGMAHQWRKGGRLLPLYLTSYVGLILLPPWVTVRNWLPVLPLLSFCLVVGVRRTVAWGLRRWKRVSARVERATVSVALLLLLGMLISDRHYLRLGLGYHLRSQLPTTEASLQEAWAWIRDNTPARARFAYEFPAKLYIGTGRQAVGLPAVESWHGALRQPGNSGVSYLVSQPERPAGGQYDPGQPLRVQAWITSAGPVLSPVFASATIPEVTVYRFDRSRP